MADYRIEAIITVTCAKSKKEAIRVLQSALDDYEDMNPGSPSIIISHKEPKRVKEKA